MNQETLANGRYVVTRRLATGGMGEVLLAEFGGDDEVAPGLLVVKRILSAAPGHSPNEQQVRMLLEEGRLGLRLSHDNLVETFRIEKDGDSPLLVIELLAGRSMAQILGQAKKRKEMVPIDVALAVLRGACCGLHFAHTLKGPEGNSLGLVHRDVSPANIFVTFDGKVKVIDFGVAKSDDSEVKTATGILKGKLGYMSPEQSIGESRLTPQADVWSLGVFFWEMLIAERLFSSPNPTATLLQISQKEIPLPRALRADVPPAVEAIAMKMLSRSLDERFKSCADIVRAIDAVKGINARTVDVGAFVAGRFPEEAASGTAEAARCARRRARVLVARDVAEGTAGVDPAEDDEMATTILPSTVREQLMASARPGSPPPSRASLPSAASLPSMSSNDDDLATVRVSAATLAQLRGQVPSADVTDEDDVATRRVDPNAARVVREGRSGTTGDVAAARPPPASVTPNPGLPPPPPAFQSPASLPSASTTSSQPAVRRPGLAVPPSTSSSTSQTLRPVASDAAPSTSPPASTLSGGPAVWQPPASPSPAPATSWVAVAVATFGALVVVMGVAFSFAMPAPVPLGFIVYEDTVDHFSVVVADRAQVPVGREARSLDLDQAMLHRTGELDPRPVARADLEARLKESGVWRRAQVPTTSKARTAALLPLIVMGIGALALAFALPLLLVSSSRRLIVQVLLAVVVVAVVGRSLQAGALGWPGFAALNDTPRLNWK